MQALADPARPPLLALLARARPDALKGFLKRLAPVGFAIGAIPLLSSNGRIRVRLVTISPSTHRGHFEAVVNGELLVRSSRTPFCDADRGVDSNSWLILRHAVAREGWASWGNQAPVADNDDGLDIPEFSRGEAAANGGAA